ncbi:MAG TPA: hypothetical protein VGM17_04885 [Rhizomicrobium sp.]|jgi:hypothetical protein
MTHTKRAALFGAVVLSLSICGTALADETTASFNLTPGTCTNPIAIPANNKPVMVMGTTITVSFRGEGHVVMQRYGSQNLLEWAGTDYYAGTENNFSEAPGAHIMWLDYNGKVDLQSATSSHVQVCNSASASGPRAGYLTFIY